MLQAYEFTAENADRCARGELTLYRFGRPVSAKLTPKQLREYEAAKVRHFVVVGRRSDQMLSDAFHLWCEGAQVPFIRVRVARKYAEVTLDLIALDRVKLHPDAIRELEELFRREARSPAYATADEVLSLCDRVPRESAGRVAAAVWAIATAPRPARPT